MGTTLDLLLIRIGESLESSGCDLYGGTNFKRENSNEHDLVVG